MSQSRRPRLEGAPAATLSDVAHAAGVSLMTVSRAMRNAAEISESTRDRVLEVARQLHYKPNPLVHSLMRQVREQRVQREPVTLGLVTFGQKKEAAHPVRSMFWNAALCRAEELGHHFDIFDMSRSEFAPSRLDRILRARGIQGLLISSPFGEAGTLSLSWQYYSAVNWGYNLKKPRLHRVAHEIYCAVRQVHAELVALGYQRIGFVSTASKESNVEDRRLGAYLACENRLLKRRHVQPCLSNRVRASDLRTWLRKERPDAVIGDRYVLEALQELGISPPERLGFANINLMPSDGDMAGANARTDVLGRAAVDLLANELVLNHTGEPDHPKLVLIESVWCPGRTVQRIP